MNTHRLFAAAISAAFAFGSVAAIAQMPSTATPEDQAKMKSEKEAAQAKESKMTPQQKAAAKKAKHQKKQKEMSQIEKSGNPQGGQAKADAMAKTTEATKSHPKPLPDAPSHQEALKQQTNKPTGQ